MDNNTQHIINHIIFEKPLSPKEQIKAQLKIVVNQSDVLLDAVNVLKDMKRDNVCLYERIQQRDYIINLIYEQNKSIQDLYRLENTFYDRKYKRFYYFKQVTIPQP